MFHYYLYYLYLNALFFLSYRLFNDERVRHFLQDKRLFIFLIKEAVRFENIIPLVTQSCM